jgi:hypothetical protein
MKTPLLSDREADSADYRALAATGPDLAERIARTMNSVALGQLHKRGALQSCGFAPRSSWPCASGPKAALGRLACAGRH